MNPFHEPEMISACTKMLAASTVSLAGFADVHSVLQTVTTRGHLGALTDELRVQGMMPLR
jgi:hypothetical protein